MERGRDVIPSYLSLGATPQFSDGGVFDEFALRYGEVQEIIYPDSNKSRWKGAVEYNVFVQRKINGAWVGAMYLNCLMNNVFGGAADQCRWTPRVPDSPSTTVTYNENNGGIALGSKVLLLCLNGETSEAYIIGGLHDKDFKDDKAKDLGHHYFSIFNGISCFIDKDGQLTVTYGGKTKIDGKKDDEAKDEQVGSYVKFSKNGNIEVSDKDGKNAVIIDHENKKVLVKREDEFVVGDGEDKMLRGSSFRDAQKQMNQKVQKLLDQASQQQQQAATALTTAAGKILGPFMSAAAAADFAQAGAFGIAASQLLKQAAEAIGAFEQAAGQHHDFLSDKDKLGDK